MKRLLLFITVLAYFTQAGCPTSCVSSAPWYDASSPAEGLGNHQAKCRKDVVNRVYNPNLWPNRSGYGDSYGTWVHLEDEWHLSFQVYLYVGIYDESNNKNLMDMYYGGTDGHGHRTFFQFVYNPVGRFIFYCYTCPTQATELPSEFFYFDRWMTIEVKQIRVFSTYNLTDKTYNIGNLYLYVYSNGVLIRKIQQFDTAPVTPFQADTQYYQTFGPFTPPKRWNYDGNFYEYDESKAGKINWLRVHTTKVQTCDECSAGQHGCVSNAECSDYTKKFLNNDLSCHCRQGHIGDGKRKCLNCNENFNCIRKRAGCSGSWPFDWEKDHLLECLAEGSNDIQIHDAVHKRKTINGLRSNKTMSFFESDDRYIFFDEQYQMWRVGGKETETIPANCSSIPVC